MTGDGCSECSGGHGRMTLTSLKLPSKSSVPRAVAPLTEQRHRMCDLYVVQSWRMKARLAASGRP